jgi:hypothetical protein
MRGNATWDTMMENKEFVNLYMVILATESCVVKENPHP